MSTLIKKAPKNNDGYKHVYCPTCGQSSGIMKVKNQKHLKINRELDRAKKAYEKEKSMWVDEKFKMESQIQEFKQKEQEAKS